MAAVTAGVVAAGAAAYSANRQSKAAKDAAKAQGRAAADSNALQYQMYQQNRRDMADWMEGGRVGLKEYMSMLGLPAISAQGANAGALPAAAQPAAQNTAQPQQAAFDRFRNTPGYQFRMQEGLRGVQASAAARGGLMSGAALKSLNRYAQGVADQSFGDHINRLASLAGIGQTANTAVGQWGQNYANQAGQNLIGAGNARAQSMYAQGQAASGLASNLAGIGGMLGGYFSNRPQGSGWGWGGI